MLRFWIEVAFRSFSEDFRKDRQLSMWVRFLNWLGGPFITFSFFRYIPLPLALVIDYEKTKLAEFLPYFSDTKEKILKYHFFHLAPVYGAHVIKEGTISAKLFGSRVPSTKKEGISTEKFKSLKLDVLKGKLADEDGNIVYDNLCFRISDVYKMLKEGIKLGKEAGLLG